MAVTIDTAPTKTQPIPVSDCLQWWFIIDPSDVVSVNGSKAFVEVVWPGSPTPPANGTSFTIWGYTFEVQSGTAYTSESFRVVSGNMEQTRTNFKNMIESHFFFSKFTTVSNAATSETDIGWTTCREQERFADENMDLTALTAMGCTVTVQNGSSPVYVDGYYLVTRLLRYDPNNGLYAPITEYEGISPQKICNFVASTPIDYMSDVRSLLYTNLPSLNSTSFDVTANYDSIIQSFAIQYGFIYREACQPKSGTFKVDTPLTVLNAAFPVEDAYGIRPYYAGASGGFPPGQTVQKFLTSQPDTLEVGLNSIAWLWFFLNISEYDVASGWYLKVDYVTTSGSGTYSDTLHSWQDGLYCVNVSPKFVVDNTPATNSNLMRYSVTIIGAVDDGIVITETKTYEITGVNPISGSGVCGLSGGSSAGSVGGGTDIYFLMPQGGIGTLFCAIEEKEINQEGTEICMDVPCIATREERATLRGRTFSDVRSFDKITLKAVRNWTDQDVQFFADMKRSPKRWLRVTGTDGNYIAKKILIDTGGIKIFKAGEKIELVVTGYLQDVPIQSSLAEPIIL